MHSSETIARALASAFVADRMTVDGLIDRGSQLLGRRWRWLRPLARRFCQAFPATEPRPPQSTVVRFLLEDDRFQLACTTYEIRVADRLAAAPRMCPIPAAIDWNLPALCNIRELADWLGISIRELDWFADVRRLEHRQNLGKLRHYHYQAARKRGGGIRLIESPKPRLKAMQRRILAEILDRVPRHEAAHGFRRGRSIKSFAAPHTAKQVVLRIDLQEFFPSISMSRVRALFRTAGYPEAVANLLTGLCTNATPDDAWDELRRQSNSEMRHVPWLYARPHLPQGAPTSPALANLCAYRLDCRLAAFAETSGASYTRYADDLAFSGNDEFQRTVKRFAVHVAALVLEEGFAVNHRKTRIMRQGVRQHLAGTVVNQHVNMGRIDFDRLKALLTNCVRRGPADQNRLGHANFREHLAGRIAYVEMLNPNRGRRLRSIFEQIQW